MAGKGKKKRNSKDSGGGGSANGGEQRRGSKTGGKTKKSSGKNKGSKFQGDIFNDAAMENAYFCCHNVQVS